MEFFPILIVFEILKRNVKHVSFMFKIEHKNDRKNLRNYHQENSFQICDGNFLGTKPSLLILALQSMRSETTWHTSSSFWSQKVRTYLKVSAYSKVCSSKYTDGKASRLSLLAFRCCFASLTVKILFSASWRMFLFCPSGWWWWRRGHLKKV